MNTLFNNERKIKMEKLMSPGSRLLYKFSSRGLAWPAILGAVSGICLFGFKWYISAIIGIAIGYILIFPVLGMFSPITYTILLLTAAISAHIHGQYTYSTIAIVFLAIHLFRTITMFTLVKRYPEQTRLMDAEYQRR